MIIKFQGLDGDMYLNFGNSLTPVNCDGERKDKDVHKNFIIATAP
jgi:hypothetical protein